MTKNQFLKKITEGTTEIFVFKNKDSAKGPGSKEKMPFFNPSMQLNRDFSILVGQWLADKSRYEPVLLDGLAASGVRGVRFSNEIKGDFEVVINDINPDCFDLIKKNISSFKLKNTKAENKNLNVLLSEEKFDYIDVDPFGSPAYFVDSAIRSIKKEGIIAFTATDTAALCGVYPKVCLRRYAAVPFHSVVMKEVGLRILLGSICRSASKYDKAIEPLASYVTDHYFRVYVKIKKGAGRANDSMKNLQVIKEGENIGYEKVKKDVGPLWMGKIHNKKFINELRNLLFEKELGTNKELLRLFDHLEGEANSPAFFYTNDSLSSFLKKSPLKVETMIDKLKEQNYLAIKTQFNPSGFKTDAPLEVIEKVFKQN